VYCAAYKDYDIMYSKPNFPKLRIIAIICWLISGWWVIQLSQLDELITMPLFFIAKTLAAAIFLAVGIAFWQLGTDKRAGVSFDSKGMMLNMGCYAAFVAWENVADMGASSYRASLLSIGSARQLGIKLQQPEKFVQSYEERLPASRGPLAMALRLLAWLTRKPQHAADPQTVLQQLQHRRARTGYDILIPETMLGHSVECFLEIVQPARFIMGHTAQQRQETPRTRRSGEVQTSTPHVLSH
jgi:hypothetical protein